MLGSFIKCQKDEYDTANIQNNTRLCGMSSHNKFLFKTSAVTSTRSHCARTDINQYQPLKGHGQPPIFKVNFL